MSREKLSHDLTAAMKTVKTKLLALAPDDVPGDHYITQFGQENLGEYLGYLGEIKIFEEEKLKELVKSVGLTSEDLTNRKLFHYFLFELNRQKASSSAKEEEQSILTPSAVAKIPKYESDFSNKFSVESWIAHYSGTTGPRSPVQEDALVIGAAKQDEGWEDSARVPSLLQKQFKEMGVQIRNYCIDKRDNSGLTAIAAHYSQDQKLTIANLGDSRAVLFVRKADEEVKWIRLTNDQGPEDVFEKARIEARDGYVVDKRVMGNLNVGRSFGDALEEGLYIKGCDPKKLISYEPDIYQYDIPQILLDYDTKPQAFLMTSCDGMYQTGRGNEETYADALKHWFSNEKKLQEEHGNNMAKYLRDYAISLGSTDNVTVCISDITKTPKQSVVTAVFDGHVGEVSAIAAEAFAQNVLDDRPVFVVRHAQDPEKIKTIVKGRAAAGTLPELAALAAIETQAGAEDIWEKATPIEIEEVKVFKGGRAAYSAEGGSLEKFKSSKDLARFIAERHAKFNFKEQGRFNKEFGLTTEITLSVEDYIRDRLKVASQKNVTEFLDEAKPDAKGLQFGNDRSYHGAYHSIITAVYTGMFADFYSKHFVGKFGIADGGLSEEQRNLAMVMTSAHDIARNTDKMSTDEHNNAFYLALILRDHLKLSQDEAIAWASHIAKKDSPDDFAKKSIYSRLTQCADCAAIVRVCGSRGFDETMLDARKDIDDMLGQKNKEAAEADLKLILDFAKAFEDKMRAEEHAGYKVNNTTFDGATLYLRSVAKDISKEGHKEFLGYLAGLSNEPKSEFISSLTFFPHQKGVEPYYDFIGTPEESLKKVPVALTGTITVEWWQIAGKGMNGQMEGHLRGMGGDVLGLANAKLADEGPKKKDGAGNAIGTVQLLDLTQIEGFEKGSQVQTILYSVSPYLGDEGGKKIAATDAKKLMNNFGEKFRTQLSDQKIPELCLPLYSGGVYACGHSPEDIAEWLMEGWLAAEEKSPAMKKVKVYLGHPCLVKAVAKLTKPVIEDGSKLTGPTKKKPLEEILGSETEIEIEGMKVKSSGEITLDLKDSKTGDNAPLVINANKNKFVEVDKKSERFEVQIESKEFRKELMQYYLSGSRERKSKEARRIYGVDGEEERKFSKEALEVLNIYRAVPSTSVALRSLPCIVVGNPSKDREK